jgi:hypothetical protein
MNVQMQSIDEKSQQNLKVREQGKKFKIFDKNIDNKTNMLSQ